MNKIILSIGRVNLSINGLSDKLYDQAKSRYENFITPNENPEISFFLKMQNKYVFDNMLSPQVKTSNRNFELLRYDFKGYYNTVDNLCNITLFENIYSLDALLRVFLSLYFVLNKAVLVHSAGIVIDGEAFVFCGKTMHGKTNIIRSSREGLLLSDELTVIRKIDDEFFAYGTPFWGEFGKGGENSGFRLKNLYFLNSGIINSIVPYSSVFAVQQLLSTILLFINDKKVNDIILDTIMDLINNVSSYKVIYNQNDDIWREMKYVRNRTWQ